MFDQIFTATVTVPWVAIVGAALLLLALGTFIGHRFGTKWLAALPLLADDAFVEALARLLWASNLIPAVWRKVRFHDSEDEFVKYLLDLAHKLASLDQQVTMQQVLNQRKLF